MKTVQLLQARMDLDTALASAQAEPVLIEDQGQPVAVVLSLAEYRWIATERERELRERVARYAAEIAEGEAGPFIELTPELWREIRSGDPQSLDPASLALPPGWRPRAQG